MKKYNTLSVWLPVIIAASIALGIFVGNYSMSIARKVSLTAEKEIKSIQFSILSTRDTSTRWISPI